MPSKRLSAGAALAVAALAASGVVRMTTTYERVSAEDVRVGDRIARARTHPFHEVLSIRLGPISTSIRLTENGHLKPRRTAKLWREIRPIDLDGGARAGRGASQ